jgi:hypothetical protein
MERVKLSLWVLATVALVKIAFGGAGEARAAESGTVSCEAFAQDPGGAMNYEKAVTKSREWFGPVQAWLVAHPGQTIFATQLYTGAVYVICVRES